MPPNTQDAPTYPISAKNIQVTSPSPVLALMRIRKPLAERIKDAEAIAKNNGGKLPRVKELHKIDHSLALCIARNPEAFDHIPREFDRQRRPRKPRRSVAQELQVIINNNGGVLPRYSDLRESNPYLAGYTRNHPEVVAGIPVARHTKARAKRIVRAVAKLEKIVAKNGGSYVIDKAFQAKHNSLAMTIRRWPDDFAHVNRVHPHGYYKTVEEHVAYAQDLASTHPKGLLPPVAVLKREHNPLYTMMRKRPEEFARFKKARLNFPAEYYVETAKNLGKKHGKLPGFTWMRNHGYVNVMNTMYRAPHLFEGIA
jgi:hypothetical protein